MHINKKYFIYFLSGGYSEWVLQKILYYTIIISSLKKKIKQYQKIIFSFVILLFIFSCKKINILAPETIPKETKFEVLSPTPTKVDVNPQPAQNGEVFGGFTKKFFYQGEWYILANYIYNYDPTNQTLRNIGSKALLKLDKDGKLLVLGRDLGNVKDGNGITTWTHLTECDIIEENQVWYQDRNTHLYGIHNIYYGEKYREYFQDAIYSNNQSYHSSDLLNWNTRGSKRNIAMGIPLNFQWQKVGGYYAPYYNVYFKGKLYVLGGSRGWFLPEKYDGTDRYDRNFGIKVIDWGNNGRDDNNWLYFGTPEGKSYIYVYLYKPPIGEEKIYIHVLGGYYWNFKYIAADGKTHVFSAETESHYPQNIYSTTGVSEHTYEVITNITRTNFNSWGVPVITNITVTNIRTDYNLNWVKENKLPNSYIDEIYR